MPSLILNVYLRRNLVPLFCVGFLITGIQFACGQTNNSQLNILFTSDAHYGITRDNFRGDTDVAGYKVNAAMIKQMNTMPSVTLPADNGVGAGAKLTAIDYLIQTGDIANRMEIPYQSAAASWSQFKADYLQGLTLKGNNGKPVDVLVVPGNHDISNAIGYYKPMKPLTDATVMVQVYNLMLKPSRLLTNEHFRYDTDKINYSRSIKGIHFIFITLWPDSAERVWMQHDLDTVARTTPVIIFTHDQPTCEAKHFTNPVPPHNMTAQNKFENLVAEQYKEAPSAKGDGGSTDIEQRGWVSFLKLHPNIKAYFHGNSNWNQFYVYKGPDNDVSLNVFRVDSPMKGKLSSKDETKLSYQLISIDAATRNMTVRECLWNTQTAGKIQPVAFGESKTVSLSVK
jgi:hypothetical protein